MVEEGIGEHAEPTEREEESPAGSAEPRAIVAGGRVRLPSGGTGEVLELRGDGTAGRDGGRDEDRARGVLTHAAPSERTWVRSKGSARHGPDHGLA